MARSDKPVKENQPLHIFTLKMMTVGGEIGCLTLIIVLLAVFGGLWLDRFLGTKPVFTVLLVLGSAPLSLVLTFWIAIRAVKDINISSEDEKDLREGEETGE